MLDLTFPKMLIANTVKFSCFNDDRRERLRHVYNVSQAVRSGRR